MGPIGMSEMMAIFVVALLLFGPKKLPELARMLAKGLSEFRRAKSELKSTFDTHMRELERETQVDTKSVSGPTTYTPAKYSYPYEDYERYQAEAQDGGVPAELNPLNLHATTSTDVKAEEVHEAKVSVPVEGTVPRMAGTQPSSLASTATPLAPQEEHQA